MPMKKGNREKKVYFSPEEWNVVCKKASKLNLRVGTYIRVISVQGEIKCYDMDKLLHLLRSFNKIGTNLNQIARVVNSTGEVYQKDIDDMKDEFDYFKRVMNNYLHELKPTELL